MTNGSGSGEKGLADLQRLLEVQQHDTAIARLTQRKESLPEAKRLAELRAQLEELEADLNIAQKQAQEISREHDRLEGEIELLEQKTSREEQRLFSGGVSNPKELGSLQAEVAMLKRKRGELDDALLEMMVQKEDATATEERLGTEQEQLSGEAETLGVKVDELSREIDAELEVHTKEREALASALPGDLLQLYDQVRAAKGGVGAAALRNGTCEGCHTQLPAVEVERLKAEGGLQRCDNCRRILVV